MDIDADRRDHQAAGPTKRRYNAGAARTDSLEPSSPNRSRRAQQDEEQRVHPTEIELGPVAVGGKQCVAGDRDLAPNRSGVTGAGDRLSSPCATATARPRC